MDAAVETIAPVARSAAGAWRSPRGAARWWTLNATPPEVRVRSSTLPEPANQLVFSADGRWLAGVDRGRETSGSGS